MYKIKFEHYVTVNYHGRGIYSFDGISIIENENSIEIIRPCLIDVLGEMYINYHKNKLSNYIDQGIECYEGGAYISEFTVTEDQVFYLKLVDTYNKIHYEKIGD